MGGGQNLKRRVRYFVWTMAIGFAGWGATAGAGEETPSPDPTALIAPKDGAFQSVLPLLQKSCFPCHLPQEIPDLPDDPQEMAKALKELHDAQADFQMGPAFPFPNRAAPPKQLQELKEQVQGKWMPPGTWTKLGWGQPITDAQRKQLLDWIAQEQKSLKK